MVATYLLHGHLGSCWARACRVGATQKESELELCQIRTTAPDQLENILKAVHWQSRREHQDVWAHAQPVVPLGCAAVRADGTKRVRMDRRPAIGKYSLGEAVTRGEVL